MQTQNVSVAMSLNTMVQDALQFFVSSPIATLFVLSLLLFFVGRFTVDFQPRARTLGYAVGGFTFVSFLLLNYSKYILNYDDTPFWVVVRGLFAGAIITASAWIVLALYFALCHSLIIVPLKRVLQAIALRRSDYQREEMLRLRQENQVLQLAAADYEAGLKKARRKRADDEARVAETYQKKD